MKLIHLKFDDWTREKCFMQIVDGDTVAGWVRKFQTVSKTAIVSLAAWYEDRL